MSKNINFDAANKTVLPYLLELVKRWLPDGERSGQQWKAKNPRRADNNAGSFSVNLQTGAWADFALNDAKGYGAISLAAYIFNLSAKVVAKNLAAMLSGKDCGHAMFAPLAATIASKAATEAKAWLPIVPVPLDAPVRKSHHYKYGNPSDCREYRDAHGKLLFVVSRFDKPDGTKEILPQTFCSHIDGKREWRWQGLPAPRPLYGLPTLAARPEVEAIVVEGEKTADATVQFFPDCVVVTSSGGARAASKTDWSPLAGRVIKIWPDNDEAGRAYAAEVARLVLTAGAKSASVVNIPSEFPEKWDLADTPPEGWDTEKLQELLHYQCTALVPLEVLPPARLTYTSLAEPSEADMLIRLAKDAKPFHTPDGIACIDVKTDTGQRRTWRVESSFTKLWLTRQFYKATDSAPSPDAMTKAINTLVAKALFDGETLPVYVRVGGLDGKTYIDLCNDKGSVVAISSDGWEVVDESPIRFLRKAGMLSLPMPEKNGSLFALRQLMNVDDDGYILVLSWLLMAMRERGPYPILVITGEQGTAKSTMLGLLRKLVDPNSVPLRTLPKDVRDLFIGAKNAWVLAFDNLSFVPAETSDALCRLSTGGGHATRALFTDEGEALFEAMRPMLFNGIENVAIRSDLADRSIILTLQPIPDNKRKAEKDFWADLDAALPTIFGGLLDAFAIGLKNLPNVKLAGMPRMADFAIWGTACETAHGKAGDFAKAYDTNRLDAVQDILANSPLASAITSLLEEIPEGNFRGGATELLGMLNSKMYEVKISQNPKLWPSNPKNLSQMLRRIAPALRKVGIAVDYPAKRVLWLYRTKPPNLAPSAPPPPSGSGTDAGTGSKVKAAKAEQIKNPKLQRR